MRLIEECLKLSGKETTRLRDSYCWQKRTSQQNTCYQIITCNRIGNRISGNSPAPTRQFWMKQRILREKTLFIILRQADITKTLSYRFTGEMQGIWHLTPMNFRRLTMQLY